MKKKSHKTQKKKKKGEKGWSEQGTCNSTDKQKQYTEYMYLCAFVKRISIVPIAKNFPIT